MATTYIQRTPSTTGTPTKFTYSVWFKRGTLGAYSIIGAALTSDSSNYKCALYLNSNDKIQFEQYYILIMKLTENLEMWVLGII